MDIFPLPDGWLLTDSRYKLRYVSEAAATGAAIEEAKQAARPVAVHLWKNGRDMVIFESGASAELPVDGLSIDPS